MAPPSGDLHHARPFQRLDGLRQQLGVRIVEAQPMVVSPAAGVHVAPLLCRHTIVVAPVSTADFGGDLLFFGVVLFVLFAEPVHCGMFVGMCRVVVRVRAFHFDGFL